MNTIYAKLIAKEKDLLDYTTYVFYNLDKAEFGKQYIMVTRWPNWQSRELQINDVGYLTYMEVIAGIDTWYDGTQMIPYNYSNIVFIKFVPEVENTSKDIIL